ncbi:S8 family serine peptidase [Deinococcus roseus]|uniref:Peptidase S8/S53 domain-containing protein n=1 Tax=Deinococcus roseus TaxID=392414 RepID=A0ABQ2D148_9DEIO|nr:S8 family serine peptidase [Deinococcus roseus]GGJ40557.1 hypothetical protein GCM10008938_28290 [Deinococcus roseus]
MKTKILSLTLVTVALTSCGLVKVQIGQPVHLHGEVILPDSVQSLKLSGIEKQASASRAQTVPGEFIVQLSSADTQSLSKQGVSVRRLGAPESLWAIVKAGSLQEARSLAGVVYAQPNYVYKKLRTPNDPLAQPGDSNGQTYLGLIGAYAAWDKLAQFTTSVKVAVVDDGYNRHKDMPLIRYDVSNLGCNTTTGVNCLDTADRDADPTFEPAFAGEKSHGASIAGIMAAVTDNNEGIAGIGYNKLTVVPIKVFTNDVNNDVTTTDAIVNAVNTAIKHDVKVINMSLCLNDTEGNCLNAGVDGKDVAVDNALKNANQNKKITIVAAAGNTVPAGLPYVAYPASSEYAIAVGSTDNTKNKKSFFSHYGPELDLVAPGEEVLTIEVAGDTGTVYQTYHKETGTSFATPMVSAAAGLLYSRNPNLTPTEIRNLLRNSGDTVTDPTISNAKFLRIDKALAADGIKYTGRVYVKQGGTVVKDTGWQTFTTGTRRLPYDMGNFPAGNYTITAEVAENGTTATPPVNLLYKCTSSANLSGDTERDLTVGSPENNPPCF